jgi:hypothetical protein
MKEFKVEVTAKIEVDGDKQVITKKLGYNNYESKCKDFVKQIQDIINNFINAEKENKGSSN